MAVFPFFGSIRQGGFLQRSLFRRAEINPTPSLSEPKKPTQKYSERSLGKQ
jgi:hypothetical protein